MDIEGKNSRVDYFSFKVFFNVFDNKFDILSDELFNLLCIEKNEFEEFFDGTFQDSRKYKFNIQLRANPYDFAKRSDGRDYSLIELSGDACEYIRQSGTAISELIDYIDKINRTNVYSSSMGDLIISDFANDDLMVQRLGAEVTRFDIAVDIIDNPYFKFEDLKKKLTNKLYQSCFRVNKKLLDCKAHSINETSFGSMVDYKVTDIVNLKDTKLGYSIKFGNLPGLCLNIYDKKAEILSKDKELLPFDELIRYEFRFGSNKANNYYLKLYEYLKTGTLDAFIGSLLFQSLRVLKTNDTKEVEKAREDRHLARLVTWGPWLDFIKKLTDEKIDSKLLKGKPTLPVRDPFKRKTDWLIDSVYNAISTMLVTSNNSDAMIHIMRESLYKSLLKGKLTLFFNEQLNDFCYQYGYSNLTYLQRLRLARDKYVEFGGDINRFKIPAYVFNKYYRMSFAAYLKTHPDDLTYMLEFIDWTYKIDKDYNITESLEDACINEFDYDNFDA